MNEKKWQTKMIKSLDAVIEQQKDCLEYLLLSKNSIEFKNDPYIPNNKDKYRSLASLSMSISELLISMEDILAIRDALEKEKTIANIRGSRENRGKMLKITSDYLKNIGLNYTLTKDGILKFIWTPTRPSK